MTHRIEVHDPTTATLDEVCDALRVWGFDPGEEESVAHAANWLRRLGNNQDFLGDVLIDLLAGRASGTRPALDSNEPNRVMLAVPGRGDFSISASIWPAGDDHALRVSGPEAFAYGVAHDHNHDFLVLGYFGPGSDSDDYEYDYANVAGWCGEPVALRTLGR